MARLLPLVAVLAASLPSESSALIHQNLINADSFLCSGGEVCRNDPINNVDPLGLEGGNVVSGFGQTYRNDFGYAELAANEWDVQKLILKGSLKTGVAIGAGILTAGVATEYMVAAGLAEGSLALSVGSGVAGGLGGDAALQGVSIAMGDQKKFSGTEFALSGVLGGGVGVAGKYLADFVGFIGSKFKAPAVGPTIEAAEKATLGNSFRSAKLIEGQSTIDDVVLSDFSRVKFSASPTYDPLISQLGLAERGAIRIGPRAFKSVGNMRETLLHEELHHRFWMRSIQSPHHPKMDDYMKSVLTRYFMKKGW